MEQMNGQSVVKNYFARCERMAATELAVADLMTVVGRNPNPATCTLFAKLLMDVDAELLAQGLGEALDTATDWMTPAQIRALCLGGSREEFERQEAEKAWTFVLVYLKDHGVEGRTKLGAVIGSTEHSDPIYGMDTPAPEIPTDVHHVLQSLGGSVKGGLKHINEAEPSQVQWVKKSFMQAYMGLGKA